MQNSKTQLLLITGGMTFKTKKEYFHFLKTCEISLERKEGWDEGFLINQLGDKCQIIKPKMPSAHNAKYNEWKIYFERYLEVLEDNIILIGVSLGGIFLARYLSENICPKKILSLYLICPPFDNTLPGEDLVGGFKLRSNLFMIERNCTNVNLLFSEDDDVVPREHIDKYKRKLPNASFHIYKNKNGHFRVSEFPELISLINSDLNKV